MRRTGIISKCDALGSWVVVAQRVDGFYTIQLDKDSIEPYLYTDYRSGKVRHELEGKVVNFTLTINRAQFGELFFAKIHILLEPIKKIHNHIFV